MPRPPAGPNRKTDRAALLLWGLSLLFLLRVLGQSLVLLLEPAWLPPMREWYSGLLPYPLLLPAQIAILAVMLWINVGVTRGDGFFTRAHPRRARFLFWFALIYAATMLGRYLVSAQLHPERRFWPPGSLPIVFHFVLAGYVYMLSRLARGS